MDSSPCAQTRRITSSSSRDTPAGVFERSASIDLWCACRQLPGVADVSVTKPAPRRLLTFGVLAMLTVRVLGCGSEMTSEVGVHHVATPPTLENLRMTTNPVVIGERSYARVEVFDPGGLVGLSVRLDFDGPAEGSSEGTIEEADDLLAYDVPIEVMLLPPWPDGEYTLTATATDRDGYESEPISTTITVDSSPGDRGELAL
jgi:hypothetical protein